MRCRSYPQALVHRRAREHHRLPPANSMTPASQGQPHAACWWYVSFLEKAEKWNLHTQKLASGALEVRLGMLGTWGHLESRHFPAPNICMAGPDVTEVGGVGARFLEQAPVPGRVVATPTAAFFPAS
ncbi:uncharacterized protein LOC120889690 [Ictidomys tridecemlineatus]